MTGFSRCTRYTLLFSTITLLTSKKPVYPHPRTTSTRVPATGTNLLLEAPTYRCKVDTCTHYIMLHTFPLKQYRSGYLLGTVFCVPQIVKVVSSIMSMECTTSQLWQLQKLKTIFDIPLVCSYRKWYNVTRRTRVGRNNEMHFYWTKYFMKILSICPSISSHTFNHPH